MPALLRRERLSSTVALDLTAPLRRYDDRKMPNADERVLKDVISFLERQKIEHEMSEEQYCTKVNARSGPQKASISVYNSGKMSVQGPASQLKTLLEQMKQALDNARQSLKSGRRGASE